MMIFATYVLGAHYLPSLRDFFTGLLHQPHREEGKTGSFDSRVPKYSQSQMRVRNQSPERKRRVYLAEPVAYARGSDLFRTLNFKKKHQVNPSITMAETAMWHLSAKRPKYRERDDQGMAVALADTSHRGLDASCGREVGHPGYLPLERRGRFLSSLPAVPHRHPSFPHPHPSSFIQAYPPFGRK